MFKNYLKIAARNLLKNRLSTIINVVGLATAVGCGIVVFLFIDDQYGRDAFHENAETIFFVESLIEREGRRQLWGFTPAPLGPSLAADFPQIKRAVRVNRGSGIMRYQDKVFEESLLFAEAGFFDMLTFPLKHGNAGALADPRGIFLGAELAQKYFGEDDPTGKQVTIRFREDRTETFTVAGVAEPFPQKASFAFDVLMPYQVSSELSGEDPQDWKNTTGGTFIQVNLPQDIDALKTQMHRYIERNNLARPDWPVAAYVFDNLLELSLNGWKVRGRIAGGTPPMGVPILLVIGALLMLLACFNHVNIAIASAGNRLTEIGVRKTMGGKRGQLIKQFLCESVLLCMIALVVGVALAQTLFVPGFNSLFPFKNLSVDFFDNLRIWLFFLGLLFLTGVVAGAYPAFYISRFQPAAIIRGKQKLDGRSRFSKFLLAFQFVLAALLTVCGIVFTQNVVHQSRIDLGYSQSGALVVPINNAKHFTLLRDEIAKHAEVVRVAGAGNHIGRQWQRNVVTRADKKYEVAGFTVGSDYLEIMKFRLQAGRTFDKNLSTDFGTLVVNERFVQEMSWQNAIGQYVNCDSVDYTVIGVVEDFHYADFRHKIEPAMFRLGGEKDFRYLIVETEAGKTASVAE
ncbi:MAG: ABC transporter permease, partial [bacterium]